MSTTSTIAGEPLLDSADAGRISSALVAAFLHLEAIDRRALGGIDPPLTNAQFHALFALQAHPGESLGQLAAHLLCDKANASGLMDRLTALGLATRIRDPRDGRRVQLGLTITGRTVLARAVIARDTALQAAFAALPLDTRSVLADHLDTLVDILQTAAH